MFFLLVLYYVICSWIQLHVPTQCNKIGSFIYLFTMSWIFLSSGLGILHCFPLFLIFNHLILLLILHCFPLFYFNHLIFLLNLCRIFHNVILDASNIFSEKMLAWNMRDQIIQPSHQFLRLFSLGQESFNEIANRLSKPLISDDGKVYVCSEKNFFAFESNGSVSWTCSLSYKCSPSIAPVLGESRKARLQA